MHVLDVLLNMIRLTNTLTILVSSIIVLLCASCEHVDAKRAEPVKIPPITFGGSIFSQSQDVCGLVIQRNKDTGEIIRKIQFYKVSYKSKLEKDVQDVWFTDFFLAGDVIWARDELGRIYKMLLKTMHPNRVDYLTDKEFKALKRP